MKIRHVSHIISCQTSGVADWNCCYRPRTWEGNVFILSVCVCVTVRVITFEHLDILPYLGQLQVSKSLVHGQGYRGKMIYSWCWTPNSFVLSKPMCGVNNVIIKVRVMSRRFWDQGQSRITLRVFWFPPRSQRRAFDPNLVFSRLCFHFSVCTHPKNEQECPVSFRTFVRTFFRTSVFLKERETLKFFYW